MNELDGEGVSPCTIPKSIWWLKKHECPMGHDASFNCNNYAIISAGIILWLIFRIAMRREVRYWEVDPFSREDWLHARLALDWEDGKKSLLTGTVITADFYNSGKGERRVRRFNSQQHESFRSIWCHHVINRNELRAERSCKKRSVIFWLGVSSQRSSTKWLANRPPVC